MVMGELFDIAFFPGHLDYQALVSCHGWTTQASMRSVGMVGRKHDTLHIRDI